jgi:hypothetical protein
MGLRELFVSANGDRAVLIHMEYDIALRVHVLDLLVIRKGECAVFKDEVSKALGLPLRVSSWTEECLIRGLKEQIRELSPNGKKLADVTCRQTIRRLYDDNVRHAQKPTDGLWLESLAEDTMRARTGTVWAGQMVGPSEVDVLAVFANQTILIECKDNSSGRKQRSLGQNAIHIAAAKSEQVNAGIVVFLTTGNGVSPGAQHVLKQLEKAHTGRKFLVVSASKTEALRAGLNEVLDGMAHSHIDYWLRGEVSDKDSLARFLEKDWFAGEEHPLN